MESQPRMEQSRFQSRTHLSWASWASWASRSSRSSWTSRKSRSSWTSWQPWAPLIFYDSFIIPTNKTIPQIASIFPHKPKLPFHLNNDQQQNIIINIKHSLCFRMLTFSPRIKPPQQRTLADDNYHQTSIRVNDQPAHPPSLKLEKITQDTYGAQRKDYSGRLSKERYSHARNTLPVGNFDWTQHKPRGTVRTQKDIKQWSCKQRLLLALLVTLIAVGLVFMTIWLLGPKNQTLREESVQPQVPTFIEMSGLMTAPKLQPLTNHQSSLSAGIVRHHLKIE